jgi:hypothetical protein
MIMVGYVITGTHNASEPHPWELKLMTNDIVAVSKTITVEIHDSNVDTV